MGGVEFRDGTLVVEREPNELDELASTFSDLLADHGIGHVFVSGYVVILAGRPRATDDIDVIIERSSEPAIDRLVSTLESRGYWGPAMPLDEMFGNLSAGTNIWIAPEGQQAPHLEVKFPTDEFDRASLDNAIVARVGEWTLPVGPLELQIAYKLSLGSRTDLEDAAHLHGLFGETLRQAELERWLERLDVVDRYDRLKSF